VTLVGDFSGLQAGMALGLASMASIGPNNLMMMREGLAGRRVRLVAGLVLASYAALIAASYCLALAAVGISPFLRMALTWAGLVAVAWFALQSLRAAMAAGPRDERTGAAESSRACLKRVLGVVWLNPLTYLEFLLIPAGLGQSFGDVEARLEFVVALILMSALCCCAYALGGGLIAGVLRRKASLRLFDLASGLILSAVAVSMAAGLLSVALS